MTILWDNFIIIVIDDDDDDNNNNKRREFKFRQVALVYNWHISLAQTLLKVLVKETNFNLGIVGILTFSQKFKLDKCDKHDIILNHILFPIEKRKYLK